MRAAVIPFRACAVALATALAVLLAGPVAAEPDDRDPPRAVPVVLRTTETNCYEIAVLRVADLSRLRQLVPARYELLPVPGTTLPVRQLLLNHYSCDVQVAGRPAQRTTVTLVTAPVSARDGVPTSGTYLLAAETDDRLLATRHRAHGLPTVWEPDATSSDVDLGGGQVELRFTLGLGASTSSGLLPEIRAIGPKVLTGALNTDDFDVYYDGPRGDLLLRYTNDLTSSCRPPACTVDERVQLFADYRTSTTLAPLFFNPAGLQPNGLLVTQLRGSMTSELLKLPEQRRQ